MFDRRKSSVVCLTVERVWSCVLALERVWSCVRSEKEFSRVFDLKDFYTRVYFRKSMIIRCVIILKYYPCVAVSHSRGNSSHPELLIFGVFKLWFMQFDIVLFSCFLVSLLLGYFTLPLFSVTRREIQTTPYSN